MKTKFVNNTQKPTFNSFQNFQIKEIQYIKGGGLFTGSLGTIKDPEVEEKKP